MSDTVIPLARFNDNAVPVTHIIHTGWSPLTRFESNHDRIDLSQRNAEGVAALEKAVALAKAQLAAREDFRDLLKQPQWNRPQRERYEALVGEAVANSFAQNPLLGHYTHQANRTDAQDLTHLNITQDYDCDGASVMRGIAYHQLDQQFLSPYDKEPSKRPQSYYIVSGLNPNYLTHHLEAHAAVISGATGNMFESTRLGNAYVVAEHPYTFTDFVAGLPFKGHYIDAKSGFPDNSPPYYFATATPSPAIIEQRRQAFTRGDFSLLDQLQLPDTDFDKRAENLRYGESMLQSRSQARQAIMRPETPSPQSTLPIPGRQTGARTLDR